MLYSTSITEVKKKMQTGQKTFRRASGEPQRNHYDPGPCLWKTV